MIRRPPRPPLLPYTTLFRSTADRDRARAAGAAAGADQIRVALDDPDALYGQVEVLRGELRVGRRVPLPVRLRADRSEEHTSELQSRQYLVCRLLLEKKQTYT